MSRQLLKRWFLLMLVGGISLAWWLPDWVRPATMRLQPRVLVVIALFLMAWSLESRSLWSTLVRPLPAVWAVLISYGPLPASAWLLGHLLPSADLRIGLLIIASAPCTLTSAVLWTRMAGGNDATALLIILLTNCLSCLATTLWLVAGTGIHTSVDTASMMLELFLVLVLPVACGQLCRRPGFLARAATRGKNWLGLLSQLLILSIILKTAVDVRDKLGGATSTPGPGLLVAAAGLCLATHLGALAAGFWTSKVWGFDRGNQIAVAFGCSQKTLPVALFLFDRYFKDVVPLAVVPIAFYHVGQLIIDTFVADWLATRKIVASD